MKITAVSAVCVRPRAPDSGRSDPAQEPVILRIETDEGIDGIAECNHAPAAVLALLAAPPSSTRGAGIAWPLLGRDPLRIDEIRAALYLPNWHSARRGLGLALLNAIDVALWDLRGKAAGEPIWRLLWGDAASAPTPYVTIYTGPGAFSESVARAREMVDAVRGSSYAAYKLEPLPEAVPEERIGEFVDRGREALGTEARLFVDLGYRFGEAGAAARSIASFAAARPEWVETPLWIDAPEEYRRLRGLVEVPLAGAEILESEWEFRDLLHHDGLDIVQPWPNRVGISGAIAIVAAARAAGRRAILGGWNATPIGVAAGVHVAAGLDGSVSVEHAPAALYGSSEARLIAGPEPEVVGGRLALPAGPGLGVALDEERWQTYADGDQSVRCSLS